MLCGVSVETESLGKIQREPCKLIGVYEEGCHRLRFAAQGLATCKAVGINIALNEASLLALCVTLLLI